MTYTSRITTAIATGAVLVNALAPIALANTVTESGNGALSKSAVKLTNTTTNAVTQTNNSKIKNNITSDASTGGNKSNFNTGGDVTIKTGDASSNVDIKNAANLNKASLNNCGTCNGGATDVTIKGNGEATDNTVKVNNTNSVSLTQGNTANFDNDVKANSSTGGNKSSYNTGGDSVIVTGDASTRVGVDNKANANIAQVGGGNGNADPSSVTVKGNGALSDNRVDLNQTSAVILSQANVARITNDVDANAKTGDNASRFNTGGFTGVSTGDARTYVGVDNQANFNAASLDCDCILNDLNVKVAGNGEASTDKVNAAADNTVTNAQANGTNLDNDVHGHAKTGNNDLNFSTGDVDGDPVIYTGGSYSNTRANNAGNVNVLDNGDSFTLPGNWDVHTSFDLSGLMSFLSGLVA